MVPSLTWGQASVNVNLLDTVYRDIDKLVGQGLVDKIIMGQRPFSRREIARITGEAIRNLPRLEKRLENSEISEKKKERIRKRLEYIEPILLRLKKRFQEEMIQLGYLPGRSKWYSVHLLDQTDFDTSVDNSLPRGIPPTGLGTTDAIINPLLQYRQGRHIVDGSNLSLETSSWLRASDHFALLVRPRFQLGLGRDGQPDLNDAYVQELYGKIFFKNFEIEVGRDNVFYGQGYDAGLLLSKNPRGLDMIKISNDIPGFLPWVFKYMGAQKLSFFYADLGPEQNFPNAYLVGWKWSLQPFSFWEIGFSNILQSGGDGSPSASFGKRVADVFPIVDFAIVTDEDFQISNKLAGVDMRFRIPPARNLELYVEAIIDDYDARRLKSIFWQDAGYVFGFYLPRLMDSGALDLRMEFHHTGIRFYRHAQFTSGWTLNKFILGDQLGPDGNAIYTWLNWDINSQNLITFSGAYERRSNDNYISIEDDDGFEFVKVSDLPKENRIRTVASWQHRVVGLPILFFAQLGYERVINFDFLEGNNRNNFLGRIHFQIFFDKTTRFPRNYSNPSSSALN